ncbi:MAG: hypothetical protein J0I12_19915 [Candidatus Eremiobacteraeota bacterium]|nr:hypothetical protein [Candidatus Eremiobacteraeota bacterium]
MQIEITVDGQAQRYEVEPGALLSEVLVTDQAVWLDGRSVNTSLMLAAQAHGRQIELKPAVEAPPLMENLLLPEPSRC